MSYVADSSIALTADEARGLIASVADFPVERFVDDMQDALWPIYWSPGDETVLNTMHN